MLVQQIVNGLAVGLTYALTAIGFTLIFGILGLVNFAHGEVYMVGAFVSFTLVQLLGWGILPGFLGGMVAGALVGMAMEKVAFKPLRKAIPEASLLATLGLSILLKEMATLIWGPETHTLTDTNTSFLSASWAFGNVRISAMQVLILAVSIALMWGLQILLYRTRVGFGIRSTAQNRDAAYLMGVNVDRIINYTFAVGSALGAAAGILTGMYYGAFYPGMGFVPGIKAFVAMVLGGLTSIPGAVAGGLILGLSETLAGAYIHSGLQDAIAFVLLVLLLLVRPTGLAGRKESA